MAKVSTKQRNAMPSSDFALPKKRKYLINDRSHAANAKARVSNKSPAVKAAVDRKVAEKYPDMGKDKKTKKAMKSGGSKRTGATKAKRMSAKTQHHNAIANQTGYTLGR